MGMMNESVYSGHRHAGVSKDAVPLAEWLIGRNDEAGALITMSDQFEQYAGFLLIPAHIADVVNDKESIPIQFE